MRLMKERTRRIHTRPPPRHPPPGAPPRDRAAAQPPADAKAWVQKEFETSGGKNWEKARYFRFDFVVDLGTRKAGPFAHYWDRWTGRYRVDVPGDDGFTAYLNVNTPKDAEKAVILKKGARVTGEDADKLLAKA
jgi:hypothetical protein